ncbi:MAG: Gfo/Idh/MocA family oxidoreductase [Terriglobia bacterium]|jgi:predicted dehydrogenase
MSKHFSFLHSGISGAVSRRQFVAGTVAAGASLVLGNSALGQTTASANPQAKIKLGLVGFGGRGSLIGSLFKKHGGFELWAVADYFPTVADAAGDALGVDPSRRFSGFSAYQKLIESGVEALALENIPAFMPDQATAAVKAGRHIYMAKPVAADVPGCLQIEAAAKLAREKGLCFFVDYQIPTDPVNIEVVKRVQDGGVGKIVQLATVGVGHGCPDPPKTGNLESRLQKLIWVNDIAMGCDYIGNYDIHAVDAALWVMGQRPVAATGSCAVARPNAHGDAHGICSVTYDYADGTIQNHFGQALAAAGDAVLDCHVYGTTGNAVISYWGKASLRCGPGEYSGQVENLYQQGIVRNIATFYENVTQGRSENPTVRRAVDSALACILGREAASRRIRLTMDDLIKENTRLKVDITGLKT